MAGERRDGIRMRWTVSESALLIAWTRAALMASKGLEEPGLIWMKLRASGEGNARRLVRSKAWQNGSSG